MFSLVTNVDEWKFFKDMHNLKTPLERDLFNFEEKKENSATMLLNGMESVYIPFKYDPHQVNVSKPSEEWQSFEITVIYIFILNTSEFNFRSSLKEWRQMSPYPY